MQYKTTIHSVPYGDLCEKKTQSVLRKEYENAPQDEGVKYLKVLNEIEEIVPPKEVGQE